MIGSRGNQSVPKQQPRNLGVSAPLGVITMELQEGRQKESIRTGGGERVVARYSKSTSVHRPADTAHQRVAGRDGE